MVEETNKKGSANSTNIIRNRLEQEHKIKVSKRTVNRMMHELNCYWGTVPLRTSPIVIAPSRWIVPGIPVSEPGHSPLLVIFAAFVVWYDEKEDELRSSFVDESVYIWPSIGQTHTKSKGTSKTLHDKTLWNDVPQMIRDAGIIAPTMDYHGNFTAELFDDLFARICQNLQKMGLEKCRIHLDGASYHFHKTAAKPKNKANLPDLKEWVEKADIKAWKDRHGHVLPEVPRKKHYENLVKSYVQKSTWSIYTIAKQYGGHIIRKTPPYHCELQPIEKIWGCVKNKVASSTDGNHTALSLKRTLVHLLHSIPQSTFISLWMDTIKTGIAYWDAAVKVRESIVPANPVDSSDEEEEEVQEGDKHIPSNGNNIMDNITNMNNNNQEQIDDNIFDDEWVLGDLSEEMWKLTVDIVNNQDKTDNRGIIFERTPDDHVYLLSL
ncbi:hypothetical protein K457DRAFT_126709 [Linnemannia elongata AG-77]|uniref:Tc1-like transposase DDE domain-containing protein n=1 Tax=Linnemannia elongata AG-77 TaxID=1314771 RepID=A0A197JV36_9FUNG|nr:hypothetical protein K457DRAFT_126709 [Linnemannia elongata AG-77]